MTKWDFIFYEIIIELSVQQHELDFLFYFRHNLKKGNPYFKNSTYILDNKKNSS